MTSDGDLNGVPPTPQITAITAARNTQLIDKQFLLEFRIMHVFLLQEIFLTTEQQYSWQKALW